MKYVCDTNQTYFIQQVPLMCMFMRVIEGVKDANELTDRNDRDLSEKKYSRLDAITVAELMTTIRFFIP